MEERLTRVEVLGENDRRQMQIVAEGVVGLRETMTAEFAAVRSEMDQGFAAVRSEVWGVGWAVWKPELVDGAWPSR